MSVTSRYKIAGPGIFYFSIRSRKARLFLLHCLFTKGIGQFTHLKNIYKTSKAQVFVSLLRWAIPGLFFFNFVFSTVQLVDKVFADVWIWTVDLLCQKRPLNQLSHNHWP